MLQENKDLNEEIEKTKRRLEELENRRNNSNYAHVCFDIGNVLVGVKLENFTNVFSKFTKQDPMFFLENLQAPQDIGLTTMLQALRNHLDFEEDQIIEQLMKAWDAVIEPNDMMLRFLENCRSDGIKIALLSNIGSEHAVYLKYTLPQLFEKTIEHLSYQVGARKPQKLYFQSFLMDHPEFTGAIYADDRPENLKAGKKYSFKTFDFALDRMQDWPLSKQKKELEKLRSYILNRKYDSV